MICGSEPSVAAWRPSSVVFHLFMRLFIKLKHLLRLCEVVTVYPAESAVNAA